ncbi:MAG: RnfABCDGE type electron transport complex subunit D [Planctomycetes bacterium]|nr:RnfABCDGE type electron transport complex subunit D [Planctomycetota bacterium]
MKLLERLLDRTRGAFAEGKRLHRTKPVFDAAENFFFAPISRAKSAPFVHDPLDIKRLMSMVIIAILPALACAVYFFGLHVLAMVVVSYAAGGIVEVLFAVVRKEEINEGFLVTGMLFPLILPPALPLWMVAVGVMFGVLVGKELFGGTGRNLFNPALVGRVFLALAYPAAMAGNWISPVAEPPGRILQYVSSGAVDAIAGATPLAAAKQGQLAGLQEMFLGNVAGSAGETSALAILLGGILLIMTRVASWRIVVGVLGSFLLMETVLHYTLPGPIPPPMWQLLAGGILFGAFFMATDPVTSPATTGGKWAYAIIIGLATALIRHLTGYVEGVMFAILLGNICAPLLDEVAVAVRLRRLAHES